jgi:hypothetical protein
MGSSLKELCHRSVDFNSSAYPDLILFETPDFGNTAFDATAMSRLEALANERIREARPVVTMELSPAELQSVPQLRSRGCASLRGH